VRVLDLIEDRHQRVLRIEQAARIRIGVRVHLRHHPLVVGRAAETLELVGGGLGRPPDAMDPPPAALRLGDRPAAIDPVAVGHL
jgi:hypothetical protein